MKTKLYILRHSETDYNVEGKHDHVWIAMITEAWKKRAEIIPELFSREKISAIFSSPLPRCINTITPLANSLGQDIIIDERIRENFFWPIQDNYWNDFSREFLDDIHDINGKDYEWYEHMRDVYTRVSGFIDSVTKLYEWKTIVICSHWGPIKHMISHIDSWTPNATPDELPDNTWITHNDAYILREIE